MGAEPEEETAAAPKTSAGFRSVERARYLEIEIAISRQLSYLRLIQDKAFLKTMVIIIITIYYSTTTTAYG